uniref:Uncharacterized protein n=1 Tax=Panagrolaimus davidi TaxID=227884 RepID=A0A914QIB5_9BILA
MDSSYLQAFNDLQSNLAKVNGAVEENKLLDAFARNYMMPWQLWKKLLGDKGTSGDDFAKFLSIYPFSFQQKNLKALKKYAEGMKKFSEEIENTVNSYYLINRETIFPNCLKSLIAALKYPHDDIEIIWKIYRKNSCSFLSKGIESTFMKMASFNQKMKNGEECDSDIFQAENDEYVQLIVSKKLGEDLSNKKLWKLYIDYLKSKDNEELLLQTYSNYCRLFLSDIEMKEEYQKASEEFGPSKVAWENHFVFEKKKKVLNAEVLVYEKETDDLNCMEDAFDLKKPFPGIYFSTVGILPQEFPFHRNLMHYLRENASPYVLQKLYCTCKFFFEKHPYPICYKLAFEEIDDDPSQKIVEQSVQVKSSNHNTFNLENLWITDVLQAVNKSPDESILLAQNISKIYRCDTKCIDIRGQVLTLNELKFLIGHGNVEDFICANNFLINEDTGFEVSLEEIAKMVPKIKFFDVASPILSSNTFSTIAKLPFKNKIQSFMLVKIEEELESHAFGEFVTKNFASGSKIELFFDIERDLVLNFKQIVTTAVENHWKIKEDRPKLRIWEDDSGEFGYHSVI